MCFETSARPPFPPISGGAGIAGTDELRLSSADGTEFSAFSVRTAESAAPGMVILPDVRGLHPFYKDLAERFAEAGVHATALDYFGRTAGIVPRDDDFEFMPHVHQTKPEAIAQDVAATVAHLRSRAGGGAQAVYTVGFCFGGRHSFNQAARGHGLAGVIGFYGVPQQREDDDMDAPVLQASRYECPVLGLFGGADQVITARDIEGFRTALDDADVSNELVTYPGAPHSFFDRSFAEHKDSCDDAWRRILRIVGAGAAAG